MLMFDFSFAQSEEEKIKQIEERIKRLELEVLKIKDINEQMR